jgi:ABC-2 type transport system permease protein
VSTLVEPLPGRLAVIVEELRKLPAFVRRDFLVAWSYRTAFVSDALSLFFGAFIFYFVGLMVDQTKIPTYGDTHATYMEFVAIGLAVGVFLQIGLGRVAAVMNREQLMGTLESLVVTPTAIATIQIGSVVYDLIYIPIRTAVFLLAIDVGFGLHFQADGILPAAVLLLFFIPFVWGLGLAAAGATLTFRRGSGAFGIGVGFLTLGSGAYFPLELLPGWVQALSVINPITVAIEGMRETLIGGVGWSGVATDLLVLAPISLFSLAAGAFAFRFAQWRERRRGTLGLY